MKTSFSKHSTGTLVKIFEKPRSVKAIGLTDLLVTLMKKEA